MGVQFPALKTMVTVFLLLMGNMSPVVMKSSIPLRKVKMVASKVVTPGSSLYGVALKDLADTSYNITCTLQVENWIRYRLIVPSVQMVYGVVTTTPIAIEPAKREAFAVRKTSDTASGVAGSVSWELEKARRRFVIMWSVPDNFNSFGYWMGLGMTREGLVDPDKDWYGQMYSGSSDGDLTFTRKDFSYNTDSIIYSNDKFEVEGDMTNTQHAQIKIVIRPSSNNWKDLAPKIRRKLKKKPKPARQRDN
uniref:Conoporin-Cn1 n=1 Tax=Conus consors TaxID=101297 RepID=ACTP_CONCN|nr:RecName: Full=Conoporin-Cn1; Flags: Precursor [Conus consors]CCI55501.1 conoporin superfamily Cn1 precursor [Conus consors]